MDSVVAGGDRMEADWDLVSRFAAGLHAAHARLVELMVSVLAEETWAGGGIRSPEHFLVLRAGLSRGQARAVVLVARRAGELPVTARLLREGRIGLDQAAVVARHVPAEFDATVAALAEHATVPQLQRSVARYEFDPDAPTGPRADEPTVDEPDGTTVGPDLSTGTAEQVDEGPPAGVDADVAAGAGLPEAVEPARLVMFHDEAGRFQLRFDAPAEVGALVEAALLEAKDALFRAGTSAVSHADALVELANRSLDQVTVASRRAKYRVNVFLDGEGGWLLGQGRLPKHVLDGLTCDGELVPVWQRDGLPVNVGRGRRVVPERTRRLIADRDRGCRFPGCGASRFVEAHHLVHWRDGGATDLDNLASLCPYHHAAHHRAEFAITGDPNRVDGSAGSGGLRFVTRGGWPIEPATPADPRQAPLESPRAVEILETVRARRRYAGPSGDPLHLHLVDFTPYPPHPATAEHSDNDTVVRSV